MPVFNKNNIISFCGIALAWLSPSFGFAGDSINRNHPDYVICSHLINNDKEKSMRHATLWLNRENSATSMHCKAISLFALGNYAEAAQIFDILHNMIIYGETALRVSLKLQSSDAWRLSGNSGVALARLDEAVDDIGNITDRNRYQVRQIVEILIKKAEILISTDSAFLAIQHLDHAYSLDMLKDKVLLIRSQAYASLKDYDSSIRDIEEILLKNSRHSEAVRLQKIMLIKQQKQQIKDSNMIESHSGNDGKLITVKKKN